MTTPSKYSKPTIIGNFQMGTRAGDYIRKIVTLKEDSVGMLCKIVSKTLAYTLNFNSICMLACAKACEFLRIFN